MDPSPQPAARTPLPIKPTIAVMLALFTNSVIMTGSLLLVHHRHYDTAMLHNAYLEWIYLS